MIAKKIIYILSKQIVTMYVGRIGATQLRENSTVLGPKKILHVGKLWFFFVEISRANGMTIHAEYDPIYTQKRVYRNCHIYSTLWFLRDTLYI